MKITSFSSLIILHVVLFCLSPQGLYAETRVNGNVSGEWIPDGNPYIATGNITIANGATLTIRPGVRVDFNQGTNLTVNGLLLALGSAEDRIIIQGANHARWTGIRLTDASDDRTTISFTNISDSQRPGAWDDQNAWGGAINIISANPTISNCIFDRNDAGGFGGTIFAGTGSRPVIEYSIIQNSTGSHGAVVIHLSSVDFNNNDVRNCSGSYCGGLFMHGGQASIVTDNRFYNNSITVNTWGSCIYLNEGARAAVNNNVFGHNDDGVLFLGVNCVINQFFHNTVAFNTGRAAVLLFGGQIVISNSILWANQPAFYGEGANFSVTYSDVQFPDIQLGQGCITENPEFLNPDENDYRLGEGSPCIDTGDPNAARDPDGSRADMGYIPPFSIDLAVTPDELDFGPVAVANEIWTDIKIVYTSNSPDAPDLRLRFQPGEGNYWIGVDPENAELALDDSTSFELIVFCPPRFRLGPAEAEVGIYVNDAESPSVIIPISINVVAGVGILRGVVTDAQSGEPVENVRVELREAFRFAVTDEQGEYVFDPLPSWNYNISIDDEGYLPYRSDQIELGNDDEIVRDIELLFASCEPEPVGLDLMIRPGDVSHSNVNLVNRGSGELVFTATPRVPTLDDVEPFDERFNINAADITGDDRIQGVEFVDGKYYVCGGDNGDGRGLIYIFDSEGNLEASFDQFANTNWGMRDITWDGELLWGLDERTAYGFTKEGELVRTFQTPLNPGRNITYERERGLFWMSGITGNVYVVDEDGNEMEVIRNLGLRIYGLAWYPEDPDGSNLYTFLSEPERPCVLRKMNIESHEVTDVHVWEDNVFTPGGCAITNQLDPLSWVFVAMLNPVGGEDMGDQIRSFHIAGRTDWVDVQPREGVIPAGELVELDVFINAEELPGENEFAAEVVVQHNGREDDFAIPIFVRVTDDAGIVERDFELRRGLQLFSLNVQPEVLDIRALFGPMVEVDRLVFVKDGVGRFYQPSYNNFCNIPVWNMSEGYLVKATGAFRMTVTGQSIRPSQPIPLRQGWQIAAYYPREAVPAPVALAGIEEDLVIAKDATGAFYSPTWGYSNLGNCSEGEGYILFMRRARNLVWNVEGRAAGLWAKAPQPKLYETVPPTGSDMSLLVTGCEGFEGEIGIYAGETLVGSGVAQGDYCGIAVRGKDVFEPGNIGTDEGAELTLKVRDASGNESQVKVTLLEGELKFKTNGFAVARLEQVSIPDEYSLASPYPNPFNSSTTIAYSLPEAGKVRLALYDLEGREVARLFEGQEQPGRHQAVLVGNGLASGLYIVRLEAGGKRLDRKVVMVR